ncbi:hypothetical protein M3I53_31260 [Paraburkholderia sp. CNPSo 3272]|uniref:hypothetical protein n=1 Tax=Paraburkholderia sp. CNPSo 3272 TaxID=2940931 RepID=UPI0020B63820|nr:hypothetical protein [Paraburkholderia sp. CNPSo 3272]MCP3727546.1 hypothetical protein [Paraburkholderia sp. CNPSo 3272]
MKYRGIVYDVGLRFTANNPYSVAHFDSELVSYDINTIATTLHANAVRIEGEEIERLLTASRIAHAAGLTIFFNPWKMNVPIADLPAYFAQAASAAEQLRGEGANIVFVCGCEITLFNDGILPGATLMERVAWLGSQAAAATGPKVPTVFQEKSAMLNDALTAITAAVRAEFSGLVTYSSGTWEDVDWRLFDVVGVDYYRNGETAREYVAGLDRFRIGKPLIVMEVGSCAYEGAAARGAGGFMLLEGQNPDGTGKFVNNIVPTRSEREQAEYVEEQLELLSGAEVDGVFIYVFSFPSYRFGEGARDLDMMSFSLVKTFPDGDPRSNQMPPWAPKAAFHRVADFFQR